MLDELRIGDYNFIMDYKSGNYFEKDPIKDLMNAIIAVQMNKLGSRYFFRMVSENEIIVSSNDGHKFTITVQMIK